ncbi:alpha/beta hydrolase [Nocardioides baekrokdamisoli]|uniref:Alpha/beta hydrolase n=1 Tax=Nocardioides baekrokdamisoli TaxID=1804624 RepID=A0A3G9IC09_9ACTN|nr:alpha/beta fold hydrolase [Nocardioides baekrokdamisoli]BBH16440.1 alpha/beta hydrolase [Nocardioides baekrokdamisoli]
MTGRLTSYRHGDLVFDVNDEGPLDGEVIVLLHGFPQLNTLWDHVVPRLHEAGYRTVAPNQRGYSPGARPRGRWHYRLSNLAADIEVLVGELGQPVHLVGHDWGAAAGWFAVSTAPHHFRSWTALSVPHPGAFFSAMFRGQMFRAWYMVVFGIPFLPARVLGSARMQGRVRRWTRMPADVHQRYWEEVGSDRARLSAGLAWYGAMPLENPLAARIRVQVPTTFAWGTHDFAFGRGAAMRCADFVEAPYEFRQLDGMGHWLPDEAPDLVAELILERVGTRP